MTANLLSIGAGGEVDNSALITSTNTVTNAGNYVSNTGAELNAALTNTSSTSVVTANGGQIDRAILNNAGSFNVGGSFAALSTFGNAERRQPERQFRNFHAHRRADELGRSDGVQAVRRSTPPSRGSPTIRAVRLSTTARSTTTSATPG